MILHMAKPAIRLFLKEWRKHRGLTQEQLAERIGTTNATISRIEQQKQNWDQAFLLRAAEELNVLPADLLTRDPSQGESIMSIWDQVPPERRQEAAEVVRVFTRRTGTEG